MHWPIPRLGMVKVGKVGAMALALWAGMLAHGGSLQAQAQFPGANTSNLPGALFANQPQVFPQDGRIKLLVLALNPTGVTESAAEQMGLILEKNLSNTGHFAVVGPRETNAAFEKDHPNLVDCREIACGVQSGKILGADRILVGTLRSQENRFYLRVRVIDPANNLTDYEEEIRFTDTSMDDDLFSLANSVSRNSLSIGRVLSTSIRGLVISLGKRQGLKIGDMMVIYKQDVPINDLEGQPIDVQRKNIAIVKVLNVNENTTEAILVHQTEEPQVGQYAATYLDPGRQIELVENTRRELDVGIRLANKVRPLELAPVALADSERKKWQYKLAVAEHDRDFWRTAAGLGAVVTLYNLNFYDSSTIGQLRLYGAAGVTVFSVIKWLHAREEINQINVEGRAKGYVWDFAPTLTPQGPAIAMSLKW